MYQNKVDKKSIKADNAQLKVVKKLNKIQKVLNEYGNERQIYQNKLSEYEILIEKIKRDFEKNNHKIDINNNIQENDKEDEIGKEEINLNLPEPPIAPRIPKGLYIYGEVGTGKTMLMDMFYDTVKLPKKRVHFHKFCLDVHLRIRKFKERLLQEYGRDKTIILTPERDAIAAIGREIASESWLLCFDEFQVTDIADALILSKLFGEIMKCGTVLIATSNRPPSDLYLNGLNRHYFLSFIDLLYRQCHVHNLDSSIDYRQEVVPVAGACYTPINKETSAMLYEAFLESCGDITPHTVTVDVMMGRTLEVAHAAGDVCFTKFQDLCEKEKGAADYQALTKNFRVIYLEGVPQLSVLEHDKARRFITLVDEIYDAGCVLVWSAECLPLQLFRLLDQTEIDSEKDNTTGKLTLGVDHSWTNSDSNNNNNTVVEEYQHTSFAEPNRDSIQNSVTHHVSFVDEKEKLGLDAAQEELSILEGELSSVQELAWAFRRAQSRLVEMSGENWRADITRFHT